MQVFKTFFKISLRFLPSTVIYVIIFGVLSMILPNTVQNNSSQTFTATKLKIAVIDNTGNILMDNMKKARILINQRN